MFKKRMRLTAATVMLTMIGSMLLNGCSGEISNSSSVEQSSAPSTNSELNIEIDQENHSYVIKSEKLNTEMKGVILTYSCPDTANVYKVDFRDDPQTSFIYNQIKDWKVALFQCSTLMTGLTQVKNNVEGKDNLNRKERKSVINSLTRIETSDFKQMELIKAGYPDAEYDDYVLRFTFPATKKDLYEITHFDLKLNYSVVLDDVKERPLYYYAVRRSIDGIPVGIPTIVDFFCRKYNDKTKILTFAENDGWKHYYDGESVYEILYNGNFTAKNIEVEQKDKPVLSFEKAFNKAVPEISKRISDSANTGGDICFYAAELVYLVSGTSDFSNADYYNDPVVTIDGDNSYIYPFWVFYISEDQYVLGEDQAVTKPLLVNAITGEVIMCN